ncbi:hypothetical protein [Bradyrhizobium sp. BRP56]|uniref:hypothetical protein n=1 Tax=Bradyrhizobium sp. BRP56 TaxID=2793819 RepID=UPI001CD45622|nr:hypothetical protein [Bradyrhizobium sp. BRP56]MCA1395488.1 hypothetical protein [Bradyrhizobium sp. BRP56]
MTNSQDQWRFQPLTVDAISIITPILDSAAPGSGVPGDGGLAGVGAATGDQRPPKRRKTKQHIKQGFKRGIE